MRSTIKRFIDFFCIDFQWKTAVDSHTQVATIQVDVQFRWDRSELLALVASNPTSSVPLDYLKDQYVITTSVFVEGE
jgi:hypothetical protein